MFIHALMFPNFGTVVKASEEIREPAAAENKFLALGVPVPFCECLLLVRKWHCRACTAVFVKGNSLTLMEMRKPAQCSLHLCVLLDEMSIAVKDR